MRYTRSRMYRCAKFKSFSLALAGFMTDGLAATLPHGALSSKDALCTQPIGMAQPVAQMTCHVQEALINARTRGIHPGLEQRPRQSAARLDRNRALSEHRVGRSLQRAISHGPVRIAHAAGMGDGRLEIGYIGCDLDDAATGVASAAWAAMHIKGEMRPL